MNEDSCTTKVTPIVLISVDQKYKCINFYAIYAQICPIMCHLLQVYSTKVQRQLVMNVKVNILPQRSQIYVLL